MITEAEKSSFVAALTELAAMKPGAKISERQHAVWWRTFSASTWTLEEFRQACAHFVTGIEFMPNPYHFDQLRKSMRTAPGEAWAFVLDFVRKGYHRAHERVSSAPKMDVPCVAPSIAKAVAAIGGFEAVAMSNRDQIPFLERRFAEHFEDLREADDLRESVPQIAAASASTLRVHGPKSAQQLMSQLQRGPKG